MKSSSILARALAALILWLTLSWYCGTWLHLHGSNLWMLRGGLALLGLVGFAGYLWLAARSGQLLAGAHSEVDLSIQEADARLRSSVQGRSVSISSLPAIFLLGDAGTAKTSTVIHCGLEPELLAGQVYQGDAVTPTRSLNVWFARQWLLVDPAGNLFSDIASRQSLLSKLAPFKISSIFGGSDIAPHAAVVCVDCESLVAPGAAESMTARARSLREALGDISHHLGVRLPVYVIFTKLDRLSYFFEYTANLTEEEAAQAFGVTLPRTADSSGVYAENESRRLNAAFGNLVFSLSDHRANFLGREHDPAKLPAIYEFPREFRKLRAVMVQFLVDLCRPSQLRTNPFLRGFYFSGVRPITLSDAAPAAPASQPQQRGFDADATRVFSGGIQQPSPAVGPQAPNVRRVPQWVFLGHLFSDIILRDQSALSSSTASVQLGFWRRTLLITAGALGLLLAAAWIISFSGNSALKKTALDSVRAAAIQDADAEHLVSLDGLNKLEDVRQSLATILDYHRNGWPLRLNWGLYTGDDLREPLYHAYFGLFRRLLLRQTQDNLIELLSRPAPSQDRVYVYNALKAYLITTSNPDKSTVAFLPPVLETHWRNGRVVDATRSALAIQQFRFYADELRFKNPFPNFATPDETAKQVSRAFLKKTATIEPLYQAMLLKANSLTPELIFNRQYPGSAEVVVNAYPVPGAFTKPGWAYMQKAIQNPKEYFNGEAWVLGPDIYANLDPAKLQQDLEERYLRDFAKIWREFLRASRVVGYVSITDAANKLGKLSGNQSPLLSLMCVVSENTALESKPLSDLFQPPQQVTPSGCRDRLASQNNAAYMDGLNRLLNSLQTLITSPANDAFRNDALTSAVAADGQVRQLARNFPVDKEGVVDSTTQGLLEEPIRYVKALIAGAPAQDANGAARSFCGQFRAMMTKYPFKSNSTTQATVQDVSDMFKPNDGALWRFYNETMQKYLVRQGSEYVAKPGSPVATSTFVSFFNRAAAVSAAFFPANAQQPQLSFAVRVNPTEDVQAVTLAMGAQSLHYNAGAAATQQFTWSGAPEEVNLNVRFAGGTDFSYPASSGPWAVFDFFSNFEHWQATASGTTMDWTARAGNKPLTVAKSGHPATVSLVLDTGNTPNIFRPGYFSGMVCPAPAVR